MNLKLGIRPVCFRQVGRLLTISNDYQLYLVSSSTIAFRNTARVAIGPRDVLWLLTHKAAFPRRQLQLLLSLRLLLLYWPQCSQLIWGVLAFVRVYPNQGDSGPLCQPLLTTHSIGLPCQCPQIYLIPDIHYLYNSPLCGGCFQTSVTLASDKHSKKNCFRLLIQYFKRPNFITQKLRSGCGLLLK